MTVVFVSRSTRLTVVRYLFFGRIVLDRRINDVSVLKNFDTVPYISFDPLNCFDFITHCFSTKLGGVSTGCYASMNLGFDRGEPESVVLSNFELLGRSAGFDHTHCVLPNQWHTTNIRQVGAEQSGQGITRPAVTEEIDGQITDTPGVTLVTYGADCVPVYLVDPVHRAVGLCHSGWKGTLMSISVLTVERMSAAFGSRPADIVAVIGPSICSECFEIGSDVASVFCGKLGIPENEIPDAGILRKGRRAGHYQLDLQQVIFNDLTGCGLIPDNISFSGLCTFCSSELFFSHRRDGSARGSMAAFLGIKQ